MQSGKLRAIILSSIFAAITAILAQVQFQTFIVPFSAQTLAVGLTATILGSRLGGLSLICYMLLGAIGLPVFSGFSGGPQVIAGPTGGFIIGFIFTAFITGWILEKTKFTIPWAIVANIVGMVITLAFGVVQLKYVADLSWSAAMATGVTPFIAFGIIKALLASWIGIIVRRRLTKAQLIPTVSNEKAA
ncbi:biotin transport system substrate-specific component [Gracilibacillus ureilyticus]|uniref:Biotin transporter n=1 Tax=Gracilibacillus ureilyticus TaxID=531814 RepID=A0A1H9P2G0_9BACI|nr:biotin transporter BioY [Gracilibacillus ureilyticus]SER42095.1 biotin transport system substrate-specific component [Gracilibacillus ureilyticus]